MDQEEGVDEKNLCNINGSTLLIIDIVSSPMPIVSVVMCILALVLVAYYKLYRHFIYRLVLYLLLAHLVNSTNQVFQVPFLWLRKDVSGEDDAPVLCVAIAFMKVYATWSVVWSTAAVTMEISSMVLFDYQLRNGEHLLNIFSFFLPFVPAVIPLMGNAFGYSMYSTCGFKLDKCRVSIIEILDDYISLTVITCVCIATMAMAIISLLYNCLRLKFGSSNQETQHLLRQDITTKYRSAVMETLIFAVYPIVSLISLIVRYLHLTTHEEGALDYVIQAVSGSAGAISSGTFFIHLYMLGSRKRNKLKYRPKVSKSVAPPVYDGQTFTTERTMTCSVVTDFQPVTESEVDNNIVN